MGRIVWMTVFAALASGCTDRGPDLSGLAFRDELSGRTFVATEMIDDGAPRSIVAGTEVRMTFGDDWINIHGDCNGTRGQSAGILQLASDSERERTDWRAAYSGRDDCSVALHDQDRFVSQFVFRGTELHLNDATLTVTNGDDQMVMTDRP